MTAIRLAAVVACTALLLGLAPAQENRAKGPPPEPPPSDRVLHMFPLKHSRAPQVAQLLQEVFGGRGVRAISTSADERTNALLVYASAADLVKVRELIDKVDSEAADGGRREQLRVFQLQFIEPDKTLEQALNLATRTNTGQFAVDRVRKQVILSADEATARAVEELLARVDRPAISPASANMQVRVVWLLSGAAREEAPPPPDDLREVLPELAKIGFARPRLAAQAVINVAPGAQFQARGMASVDGPCQFAVTGVLGPKAEDTALQISLRATRGQEEIGNIETQISAPPGHLVVLGVTPTGSLSSAFVVQVLRADGKPPARRTP